ncbi:MAG TPA: ABC transporter ATP-binding protein [Chloroflexia bacterium]|nr:ABC transporter ATP-binding protein [Chloroflexia bacterium]
MSDLIIDVQHLTKTYEGVELSLRGTKLELKGPALWFRNLSRSIRLTSNSAPPVKALEDVSLKVNSGEILGLVGHNGSGKTTLIKILSGLLRPTDGTGLVAGISLEYPRTIRARVSYVSTSGWMGLEWPLTAEENIRFFASLCGMPSRLARERTKQALEDVELWQHRSKYPSQLSNGMRQRVILARALLFRTPLVLLDEPTVGLDPITNQAILKLIKSRLRERGQTIIVTDHRSSELEGLADRVAVLQEGRIAMEGSPAQLRERLEGLAVIEVQTEEMDLPAEPPPALVVNLRREERPGPLGLRAWRVHVYKSPQALQNLLDWLVQPSGRVVFLAESKPVLADVIDLAPSLRLANEKLSAGNGEPGENAFQIRGRRQLEEHIRESERGKRS